MALAIGFGMLVIKRPNAGHNPHSTMSAAQTRNAPTTDPNSMSPVPAPALTRSAAPGVDHANEIGMRNQKPSTMHVKPAARHSAKRPEAACASVAPTARNPAMTSANELAKPVIAAIKPAEMGWRMFVPFAAES